MATHASLVPAATRQFKVWAVLVWVGAIIPRIEETVGLAVYRYMAAASDDVGDRGILDLHSRLGVWARAERPTRVIS